MNALKLYVGWLRRARSRFLDDDTRVARAFDAGYALLLDSAEANGLGEPPDHPSANVVRVGARVLGVTPPDAKQGIRLLRWADWKRYIEPKAPPYAPDDAISWAERIKSLYVARRHRNSVPKSLAQRIRATHSIRDQ